MPKPPSLPRHTTNVTKMSLEDQRRFSQPLTSPAADLPRPLVFALGAGGSHGAVQVGQLRALFEAGLCPDFVIGCSVGALNAAAISTNLATTVERLEHTWRSLSAGDVFPMNSAPFKNRAICGPEGIARLAESILPAATTFTDLALPLHVVATEATSSRRCVLSGGRVLTALLASCAVPMLLPPVALNGTRFLDGGIRYDLPLAEAIAIGAGTVFGLPTTRWPRPIGYRASFPNDSARLPEILILDGASTPGTGWTFTRTAQLIHRGYQAASRQLARLPQPRWQRGVADQGRIQTMSA